jgi:hypothetical protein
MSIYKVYTPSKKQLPSWMMMNDVTSKHWMTSADIDMEVSKKIGWLDFTNPNVTVEERGELDRTRTKCTPQSNWNPSNESINKCNETAMTKSEIKVKHAACEFAADSTSRFAPNKKNRLPHACDMYSAFDGKIFPEYKHCLTKDGLKNNYDCQLACYMYPTQKGCESVANMTETQRNKEIEDKKDAMLSEDACKAGQLEYSRGNNVSKGDLYLRDFDCMQNALIHPELKARQRKCKETPNARNCRMYYTNKNGTKTLYPEYANCVKPGADARSECQFACFVDPTQKGCELVKQITVPGTVLVYDRDNNTVRAKFTTPDKRVMTTTKSIAGIYKVNQPVSVVIAAKAPYTAVGVKRV